MKRFSKTLRECEAATGVARTTINSWPDDIQISIKTRTGKYRNHAVLEYANRKDKPSNAHWVNTFDPVTVERIEAQTHKEIQLARLRKRLVLKTRKQHITKYDAKKEASFILDAQEQVINFINKKLRERLQVGLEAREIFKILSVIVATALPIGGECLPDVNLSEFEYDDTEICDGLSYNDAVAAKEVWLARDRNLDNAIEAGELIPLDELALKTDTCTTVFRSGVVGLPSQFAPITAQCQSVDEMVELVNQELNRLLSQSKKKSKYGLSIERVRKGNGFSAPTDLSLTEWSDEYMYLSREDSAEPGKYRSSRAAVQRGIMDAVSDPDVEDVTLVASSQIGKTQILKNAIAYFMHQDPSPMLLVQPTLEMAKAFSKERLAPTLRDVPCLAGLVTEKSKDSDSTILEKHFPGGSLAITGANSPSSLASRPRRIVLQDEIDKYQPTAAGDSSKLADNRTKAFWNAKKVKISTPLLAESSRILAEYEKSDKQKYWVPCPHCGEHQVLKFSNVIWDKDENGNHQPETARYACEHCGACWDDVERWRAIQKAEELGGGWRAERPEIKKHKGFWLWEAYSSFSTLEKIVNEFLEAQGDPELLQVFTNECLAEGWEEEAKQELDSDALANRREVYPADVPMEGIILTAGVDVQDDRLEVEVAAWGLHDESWSIDYKILDGDPSTVELWNRLDTYLQKTWAHESGRPLTILSACVDTGGHHTQKAYEFCKARLGRKIWAIKGANEEGYNRKPIWPKNPSRNNKVGVSLYLIGTQAAKDQLFNHLKITEPGPGFCHFPSHREEQYFDGLTVEKSKLKYQKGKSFKVWVCPSKARNEPTDCRVYAMAAKEGLKSLGLNFEIARASLLNPVEHSSNKIIVKRRPCDR